MLGCQKRRPYVFAGDQLSVVKGAAARDLEKILGPKNDDFVASRTLDRRRDPPVAPFDDVYGAIQIIPFASLAKGPADTPGYC